MHGLLVALRLLRIVACSVNSCKLEKKTRDMDVDIFGARKVLLNLFL
jgi:hypothetical protein